MMLKLFESHVKHVSYWPWKKSTYPYVEEEGNRATGTVVHNTFNVSFTNSYGNAGRVYGKIYKIGKLWILKGTALGYKKYPEGRPVVSAVWYGKGFFYMVVPGEGEFLKIKIRYEEL